MSMYLYAYWYIYLYGTCICVYLYIYIERERERDALLPLVRCVSESRFVWLEFGLRFGLYTIWQLPILYGGWIWHTQGGSGGGRILRNSRATVLQ